MTEQLGFKLLFDHQTQEAGRFVAIAPDDGPTVLGLIAPQPGSAEYDLIGRSGHVVLVTDDVMSKYEEWKARGVVFRHAPFSTNWRGIVTGFLDPDGNSFALMSQDDLSRKLERDRRAEIERAEAERRAARDLEIAREVQTRLFPQSTPALRSMDFAGRCLQAREVGGDYFDFLPLGGEWLGLVAGDISGKGIAAALLMANLQASIRSQSAVALEDPRRFLRSVNGQFFENSTPGSYATLFFGEYSDRTGEFRYVNCGHPHGLLLRANGSIEELRATTTVLGLFADWDCSIETTWLGHGDTVVLCTDGVSEYFNADDEEFGMERLASVMRRSRGLCASALLDEIIRELREFSGGEQQDDMTLIVARRHSEDI